MQEASTLQSTVTFAQVFGRQQPDVFQLLEFRFGQGVFTLRAMAMAMPIETRRNAREISARYLPTISELMTNFGSSSATKLSVQNDSLQFASCKGAHCAMETSLCRVESSARAASA